MRLPLTVAAVLALALAGCGGSSASDEAKSTAQKYFNDLAASNGKEVCKEIIPQLKKRLETQGPHDCVEQVNGTSRLLTASALANLKAAKVTSVTVSGSKATAQVQEGGGHSATVKLVKEPSGWKIESVSGSGL